MNTNATRHTQLKSGGQGVFVLGTHSAEPKVFVVDKTTGGFNKIILGGGVHKLKAHVMGIDAEGKYCVSASVDGVFAIWKLDTYYNKGELVYKGEAKDVGQAAIFRDENELIVALEISGSVRLVKCSLP